MVVAVEVAAVHLWLIVAADPAPVARKDVAEEKHHSDLCQSGHASTHDLHLPSHHALCKVLSQEAQQLAYGLLIKS